MLLIHDNTEVEQLVRKYLGGRHTLIREWEHPDAPQTRISDEFEIGWTGIELFQANKQIVDPWIELFVRRFKSKDYCFSTSRNLVHEMTKPQPCSAAPRPGAAAHVSSPRPPQRRRRWLIFLIRVSVVHHQSI